MFERGLFSIEFNLADEAELLGRLMRKYEDLPMSLADACLVRMAEINPTAIVFTLDRHFRVYRKHGRQAIEVVTPDE